LRVARAVISGLLMDSNMTMPETLSHQGFGNFIVT